MGPAIRAKTRISVCLDRNKLRVDALNPVKRGAARSGLYIVEVMKSNGRQVRSLGCTSTESECSPAHPVHSEGRGGHGADGENSIGGVFIDLGKT